MENIIISNIFMLAESMPPRVFGLDWQLLHDCIMLIIAVFILFLFLSYNFFNPVRNILQKRSDKIKDELEEAKKSMEDAQKLKEAYQQKLDQIQVEADQIMSDARRKAVINEVKIISDAKDNASRIIAHAEKQAELQKQKLADEIKTEIINLSSLIAGKVVTAAIDTTVQNELFEQTLRELGEDTWLS